MEVAVAESNGIPDGCLLSVRAGNTRRQAIVPLTEPFRFPNLPFNAKQFKIDVLKPLGSTRLDINAQNVVESYNVAVQLAGESKLASLSLSIRENPGLCGRRQDCISDKPGHISLASNEPSRPGTTASHCRQDDGIIRAVRDTREYAQTHNIPNIMQEMLQGALRDRPRNPFSQMATQLARLAQERNEDAPNFELPTEPTVDDLAERLRLEAEHLALQEERHSLLRELMRLEGPQRLTG